MFAFDTKKICKRAMGTAMWLEVKCEGFLWGKQQVTESQKWELKLHKTEEIPPINLCTLFWDRDVFPPTQGSQLTPLIWAKGLVIFLLKGKRDIPYLQRARRGPLPTLSIGAPLVPHPSDPGSGPPSLGEDFKPQDTQDGSSFSGVLSALCHPRN